MKFPYPQSLYKVGDTLLPSYLLPPTGLTERPGWDEITSGGKWNLRTVEHFKINHYPKDGYKRTNLSQGKRYKHIYYPPKRPYKIHIVALITEAERGKALLSVDTSSCSPKDNYNRKTGFTLAFRRALHLLRHNHPLKVKEEIRLRWYFRRFVSDLPKTGRPTRNFLRSYITEETGINLLERPFKDCA